MATDLTRPPLGFEYEIAIALIDTSKTLDFSGGVIPGIIGNYFVVACTRELQCSPPISRFKHIACGYNPAAIIIPAMGSVGSLSFRAIDKPKDQLDAYAGQQCVARLKTTLDGTSPVRTWYCCYWGPQFSIEAPEGDAEGRCSAQGDFTALILPD